MGHSLHWEGAPWPSLVPQIFGMQPSMLRPCCARIRVHQLWSLPSRRGDIAMPCWEGCQQSAKCHRSEEPRAAPGDNQGRLPGGVALELSLEGGGKGVQRPRGGAWAVSKVGLLKSLESQADMITGLWGQGQCRSLQQVAVFG